MPFFYFWFGATPNGHQGLAQDLGSCDMGNPALSSLPEDPPHSTHDILLFNVTLTLFRPFLYRAMKALQLEAATLTLGESISLSIKSRGRL